MLTKHFNSFYKKITNIIYHFFSESSELNLLSHLTVLLLCSLCKELYWEYYLIEGFNYLKVLSLSLSNVLVSKCEPELFFLFFYSKCEWNPGSISSIKFKRWDSSASILYVFEKILLSLTF